MLHILAAKKVEEQVVWISFDDSVSGEIDLSDNLMGPVFDPHVFDPHVFDPQMCRYASRKS